MRNSAIVVIEPSAYQTRCSSKKNGGMRRRFLSARGD